MKSRIFNWRGITKNGKLIFGFIQAKNYQNASMILLQKNITPIKISKSKRKIIKSRQLIDFTEQLSVLTNANLSIIASLKIIKQSENKNISQLAEILENNILSGKSFSETLKENNIIFDPLYIGIIMAGEKSAQFGSSLNYLVSHFKIIEHLKNMMKTAMIYPSIVFIVSIFILVLIISFIIPQFNSIYNNLNVKLPAITQFLIHFSLNIKRNFLLLLTLLTIPMLAYHINDKFQHAVKILILKLANQLPIIKKLLQHQFLAHWIKLLATMTKSEIPLFKALNITLNMNFSKEKSQLIKKIINKINAGASFSNAMKSCKSSFPEKVINLINVAENAGNLPLMLEKIANIYYELVKNTLNNLCKLLEPVIIILLSFIIGFILIAMYLPIFNISSLI